MKDHFGCPVQATSNVLAEKWKVLIVWHLSFGSRGSPSFAICCRESARRSWPHSFGNSSRMELSDAWQPQASRRGWITCSAVRVRTWCR